MRLDRAPLRLPTRAPTSGARCLGPGHRVSLCVLRLLAVYVGGVLCAIDDRPRATVAWCVFVAGDDAPQVQRRHRTSYALHWCQRKSRSQPRRHTLARCARIASFTGQLSGLTGRCTRLAQRSMPLSVHAFRAWQRHVCGKTLLLWQEPGGWTCPLPGASTREPVHSSLRDGAICVLGHTVAWRQRAVPQHWPTSRRQGSCVVPTYHGTRHVPQRRTRFGLSRTHVATFSRRKARAATPESHCRLR